MIELGKLVQDDPRLVWPHEAHNFTPWLLQNSDHLAEALGIDLAFKPILRSGATRLRPVRVLGVDAIEEAAPELDVQRTLA